MKKMKKLTATLLALAMVLGLAACGPTNAENSTPPSQDTPPAQSDPADNTPAPAESDPPSADGGPIEPDAAGVAAKWSEETTADGWIKVTNQGGATLGYHPDSGKSIIQVDGFAFKDLNGNGKLDVYEDWRNSYEDRAHDLADQMSGAEIAPMTTHGGWAAFGDEYDHEDPYVNGGGRGGVTRSSHSNGNTSTAVKWTNSLQELCESLDYGVPACISVDPSEISNMINTLSLGATMNTDLAFKIGQETAKQYRAVGISVLLGPQVDLMGPTMDRASGTMGEDPRLTRDLTQAFINGMQSTYSASGEDLGWGEQSVYCTTKHFAGAGASEGGRNDHRDAGRYSVFPGNNFEAHLIAYFDGAFNLPGKTGSAGVMMQYAINVVDGKSFGGEFGGAYNEGLNHLLRDNWIDSFTITDWGIINGPMANWGVEDWTAGEAIARLWEMGNDHIGLLSNMDEVADGYAELVRRNGQDKADEILRGAMYNFALMQMQMGMYENPYLDGAYAEATVWSDSAIAFGNETRDQAVIMLKNDGSIKQGDGSKPTVYVPSRYVAATTDRNGNVTPATFTPCADTDTLSKYVNVITDTIGTPTGEDGALTEKDVVRASAADIAGCNYILIAMTAPYTGSSLSYADEDQTEAIVTPASLQYGEYTATDARSTSLGRKSVTTTVSDGYTMQTQTIKVNRSYKDVTVPQNANYAHLELLQEIAAIAGDTPVVVSMQASRGMVWSEVEPLADVILMSFANRIDSVGRILDGSLEPSALLPMQQPANMSEVEKQQEDVARDMQCYKDSAGNVYDFAFGMNWSGVINDSRVSTYTQAPLTKVETVNLDISQYCNMGQEG